MCGTGVERRTLSLLTPIAPSVFILDIDAGTLTAGMASEEPPAGAPHERGPISAWRDRDPISASPLELSSGASGRPHLLQQLLDTLRQHTASAASAAGGEADAAGGIGGSERGLQAAFLSSMRDLLAVSTQEANPNPNLN